jgi:hypothetical protein
MFNLPSGLGIAVSAPVSCLLSVDSVELRVLRVHLQMFCAASRIANLWDRVSVLLPLRSVSVGCKFILLVRSVVGTMSRTTLYQADRTLSDTTTPQVSLLQNTVLCVCTYLCYIQRRCLGVLCYVDPKRERTRECTPLHSELVLF